MFCYNEALRDDTGITWDNIRNRNRMTSCFIPYIKEDMLYLPKRGNLPLRLKVRNESFNKRVKKGFLRVQAQEDFAKILTEDLGISTSMARVISSRSIAVLHRIEEQIMGLIDAFLLAFPEWFIEPKRFTHIIRVTYNIGAFDLDLVTKHWKEFINYVWIMATESETIEPAKISNTNPFRRYIQYLEAYIPLKTKCQAEKLIHLMSSRQLVSGSGKTEVKALNKFITTTSNEFKVKPEELERVRITAKQLGKKCLRLLDDKLPKTSAHISLSAAGDYNTSVAYGGRCTEIIEAVRPILTRLAEEDRIYSGPMGFELKEEKHIPVWRTWGRETRLDIPYEFGELMEGNPKYWNDDRRAGFDDAIGFQIFICALFEMDRFMQGNWETPIPCRSCTVPEPGGKARIVTTTLWWNVILQQPAGHFFKDCLIVHPSAEAGLQRADQAWLYIDTLANADLSMDEPVWYLSSDLSEATDAIPPLVAKSLAEGFAEGLGCTNPLLQLSINLAVCPRLVDTQNGEVFVKRRGILMGEPLTKSLLTLLNLACEERAIRDFLEIPIGPINVKWRAFSVGGDDHIGVGPKRYLNLITDNHLRWGSIISKDKHALSQLAVRYCEKCLYFKSKDTRIKAFRINKSVEDYENSIFVDSVKIRLLSPVSKSFEIENDRNIAIGKAKSFGRTVRWLNDKHFPRWWKYLVRNRFWSRMRDYLPKMGTSLAAQLMLPEAYGGLDLYLSGELEWVVNNCPLPTKQFIYKLITGISDYKLVNRFKRFCSNDRMRGQSFASFFRMAVDEYDFDELGPIVGLPALEPMTIFQARDKYEISKDTPLRKVTSLLNKKGIFYSEQIIDKALRPTLFNEMLAKTSTAEKWNTTPWKKRYAQLWDDVIDLELGSPEIPDLNKVERPEFFLPLRFYDVNTREYDDEDEPSFIELIEDGLPNLKLPFWVLGAFPLFKSEPDL